MLNMSSNFKVIEPVGNSTNFEEAPLQATAFARPVAKSSGSAADRRRPPYRARLARDIIADRPTTLENCADIPQSNSAILACYCKRGCRRRNCQLLNYGAAFS